MIRYIEGDATVPVTDGPTFIAHVVNDAGGWGAGFSGALSRRYPKAEEKYRWMAKVMKEGAAGVGLGFSQVVYIHDRIGVVNMVAQHGYSRPGEPAIRYDALAECLLSVAQMASIIGAVVQMPRIGVGLGGGSWGDVEPLIEKAFEGTGVDVYVVDLPRGK